MTMTFTIIDAAIIFIYLMGMLVLGFIMGKTNKTQEDYSVAANHGGSNGQSDWQPWQ